MDVPRRHSSHDVFGVEEATGNAVLEHEAYMPVEFEHVPNSLALEHVHNRKSTLEGILMLINAESSSAPSAFIRIRCKMAVLSLQSQFPRHCLSRPNAITNRTPFHACSHQARPKGIGTMATRRVPVSGQTVGLAIALASGARMT